MARDSFEHAGLQIAIDFDPAPRSPREDPDVLGHMVFWHPRGILGDEPPLRPGPSAPALARTRAAKVWLPLWVGEGDAGLTLRIGGSDDADVAAADGLIYATARDVRRRLRLFHISRRALAEARAILRREVQDYAQFIGNEMLQFVITDQDDELLERRGGFYTREYATAEALRLAQQHARQLARYAPQRLLGKSPAAAGPWLEDPSDPRGPEE